MAGCSSLLTFSGGSDPGDLARLGDAPSLNKALYQSTNGPPVSLFLETDSGGLETRFGTPPTLLPKSPKVVGETLDKQVQNRHPLLSENVTNRCTAQKTTPPTLLPKSPKVVGETLDR